MLEPEEQLGTLQLLIYLLPPCNCDTLHRLLQFLSIVARHADDNVSKDGQEVWLLCCCRLCDSSFLQFSKGRNSNMTEYFSWRIWYLPISDLSIWEEPSLKGQFLGSTSAIIFCVFQGFLQVRSPFPTLMLYWRPCIPFVRRQTVAVEALILI